jgi:starch phosphorylase
MIKRTDIFPFSFENNFKKSVTYFSMEFALDQALKTYSGGLGFLAGSHMKSAFELKQNLIGIGILWKYGYYDQQRNTDNSMKVHFREQMYSFLKDTKIRFQIEIASKNVWVNVYYLPAEVFQSAPMFFLTTDVDGNDEWARSISYHLYDKDATMKVAQCMLLGIGGVKFLDSQEMIPDVIHLNEAHAISSAFYLLQKGWSIDSLKSKIVFTTHTPEEAGNEKHNFDMLYNLNFFCKLPKDIAAAISGVENNIFNHTLAALRIAGKANAVSALHGKVAKEMWKSYPDICDISYITNAQNRKYWQDSQIKEAYENKNWEALNERKKVLKSQLFKVVADQVGKLFDNEVLTIVWARRFAGYKRPDLITRNKERFHKLMTENKVQIIWAGKPYPFDYGATDIFNQLYYLSHLYPNMAVLTGHELGLSKLLKDGSDVWMNTPIVTREASGTSGMTAAMNASLNFSTFDGWICEFANNNNSFVVPIADDSNENLRDEVDFENFLDCLEKEIIPMYYQNKAAWSNRIENSIKDVSSYFDSDRMATEYYEKLYNKI